MKESLHLDRPTTPFAPSNEGEKWVVNLRTVEHYRLVYGLDGEIDPDLP
jgi:hypothetical protein